MRRQFVLGVTLVAATVAGAAADMPTFRGDRFRPLSEAELTADQKTMVEHLLAGPRGGVMGPFNAMLRSPDLGDRLQKVGEYVRFKTSLPPRLNELAILVVARTWTAQYEWFAHRQAALKAGIAAAVIDDIAEGRQPTLAADEAAIYGFARELLATKGVTDATFAAVKDRFGERGVADLIGLVGYYEVVSMYLNVDRYPLPEGAQPLLKPLAP